MEEWRKWKHITKLDPDRKITPAIIRQIVETGTDAIMVSGTQNIKKDDVIALLKMLKDYDIPKVLEPAGPAGMVYEGYDWLFVPSVFNTNNAVWINGLHRAWVKRDSTKINWDVVVPEALIILNPKCAAAKVTKANHQMSKEEVVAAAVCAEQFFKFPVVYIEYSGTYGDPAIVQAVKEALKKAHLIYGGGINTKERAEEMSRWASIVVGNTIYENGTHSFINTMRGRLLAEMQDIQVKLKKLKKMSKQNGNQAPTASPARK